jgi:hypothetical protein
VLLGVLVSLAVVAPAQAHRYINHESAVSHARAHWHLAGYHHALATCSPIGPAFPGHAGPRFHKWACEYVAFEDVSDVPCSGDMIIAGSLDPGFWIYNVQDHHGFCPWGVRGRRRFRATRRRRWR